MKSAFSGVPDTLEIFVLYTEFKKEQPQDNESTTGNGTFNSGKDTFNLDPRGFRKHRFYLDKHMEFARDYFWEISNGRLFIDWQMFPGPEEESGEIKDPYELEHQMAFYSPTRKEKEKKAVFDERKVLSYIQFVAEVLRKANSSSAEDNPFLRPKSQSENRFRSYLIFHAGYNGLIDGGSLGELGADTPNDIIDFFVTKDYFNLLGELKESDRTSAKKQDSIGIVVASGDTIREVMVLSESASQDDVNWGINGVLVNQIARQIGMPDTWDRGRGFTQLGYFDMMDIGHVALSGFIPVYPSAWVRSFMGWENPVRAYPGENGYSDYELWSPLTVGDSDNKIASLKIQLNDREFLLVENRQRASNDSVTIYFSKQKNKNDKRFSERDSITIAVGFIDSLFRDSLCNDEGKKCKPNSRKPGGIITGASSYDMGLPASGLLVWHVNEWFIEQTIRWGYVNLADDKSKEWVGINLVEADGDLSIGIEGKDQLGQSIFDYGSGSDMLPHVRKAVKEAKQNDTTWTIDTLKFITPFGHANTNSWNDGKSHILLEALIPENPENKLFRSMNPLTGDSIFSFQYSGLTLRVHWNKNQSIFQGSNWKWPVMTLTGTNPQSIHYVRYSNALFPIVVSDGGYMQIFSLNGGQAIAPFDTVKMYSPYDSINTLLPTGLNRDTVNVPVHSLGGKIGGMRGSAMFQDTLSCVLSADGLFIKTIFSPESALVANNKGFVRDTLSLQGLLGPVVTEDLVWILESDFMATAFDSKGKKHSSIEVPEIEYHTMAAYFNSSSKQLEIVLVGEKGRIVLVNLKTDNAKEITDKEGWSASSQFFQVVSSDFDRDGQCDLFVLGSRGDAALLNQKGEFFPNFPKKFPRSAEAIFLDSIYPEKGKPYAEEQSLFTEDRSAPAVADLNQDGYPDILFTGINRLLAVDFRGEELWRFKFAAHQDVGQLYHSSVFQATVIQSSPLVIELKGEITVLASSPDGLIWAINGNGSPLETSAFNFEEEFFQQSGFQSLNRADWPLSAGGLNFDTTDNPFLHISFLPSLQNNKINLFAQSGTGSIYAWLLSEAELTASANWSVPGGNVYRQNYFDASRLKAPSVKDQEQRIREFHFYPSPLTGPSVNAYLDIGAPARKAKIRLYDLGGAIVKEENFGPLLSGPQSHYSINLSHLGPDVYTALLEVWFENGTKKQKWERIGVIR